MDATKPAIVSIPDAVDALTVPFQPVDLALANDAIVRLARLQGAFDWHRHDEDELFLCWEGSFRIELEGAHSATLRAGELFVVPAGTPHRPVADDGPAYTLLLERPETRQRGNAAT